MGTHSSRSIQPRATISRGRVDFSREVLREPGWAVRPLPQRSSPQRDSETENRSQADALRTGGGMEVARGFCTTVAFDGDRRAIGCHEEGR